MSSSASSEFESSSVDAAINIDIIDANSICGDGVMPRAKHHTPNAVREAFRRFAERFNHGFLLVARIEIFFVLVVLRQHLVRRPHFHCEMDIGSSEKVLDASADVSTAKVFDRCNPVEHAVLEAEVVQIGMGGIDYVLSDVIDQA